jgi:hypothetical protein
MLLLSCIITFLLSLLFMTLIKTKISNKYMVPKFNTNIKFKLRLGKLNMWILKYYIKIRWENLTYNVHAYNMKMQHFQNITIGVLYNPPNQK